MADEDASPEDQTEDPSERKLEEARKEGDVPLSRDVPLVCALGAGAASLTAFGDDMVEGFISTTRDAALHIGTISLTGLMLDCMKPMAIGMLIITSVVAAALAGTFVQTGAGFWLNRVTPDASRLFSMERITHAFTRQGLADLGVAALKATMLLGITWRICKPALEKLRELFFADTGSMLEGAWTPLRAALPPLAMALLSLMAIDAFLTFRRFKKKMSMTKDAARREHKEEEGDPHLKSRRRRKHQDLAKGRTALEVPRADAIIVNPTEFAVAIRYRKKKDKAPRVTAKGKGEQAKFIRELAAEHGIPIYRDVPLCRYLYKKVKVGKPIPSDTYRAVAAVLAYVFKITGRAPGTGAD